MPEILEDDSGLVKKEEEVFFAFLIKPATKEEKYDWLAKKGFVKPEPTFFRQHFWLAIIGDEITLLFQAFLQPMTKEQTHD